jgi:outer membrane receptor protein involved in Fe transport
VAGLSRLNDLPALFPDTTYTVVNTKLSYQWKQLTTYVAVNNLLDRLYEQAPTSGGFFAPPRFIGHNPAPGLNFQLGATLTF